MLHEQAELTGTVQQGVIVIDEGMKLPEGQTVKIIVEHTGVDEAPQTETADRQATESEEAAPSDTARKAASPLGELLLKFAGIADDLPPDMAKNHDHYLYGAPKHSAESADE